MPKTQTDKQIVNRCLNGHPDDYRLLVRRYHAVLHAHLVGQLQNRDMAEDAVQEVLVRSYFNLSKLKKREQFFSWMLGIGNRVAKEKLRENRQRREHLQQLNEQPRAQKRGYDYGLVQAIGRLDDGYKELILLRFYGGFSCSEIAKQLSAPLGTVTKRLSRAYSLLKEELSQAKDE
jgi:RNA polymerase sigma-70 factor (ECF subfamily)